MNTTTETREERRARIHAGVLASFEEGVRYHFANPPETWTVRKAAERCWHIVNAAGGTVGSFKTKRVAEEAIKYGVAARNWRERDEWCRGTANDPRNRALTDEEREIVARVLAELPEYGPDNRCTLCGSHIADPHAPECPRGDDDSRECAQIAAAEHVAAMSRTAAVARYQKWRAIRD